MKTLDPMMDFVFKALFGKEDKISKELLIALLNDILQDKGEDRIESITYLNPFNYKEFQGDKLSILDIKAKTEKGEMVNIEVQVRPEDNYRKRSLYYWSKSYAESILESETYESLKKTIIINIMGYEAITESEKFHTTFKILEEKEHFTLIEDLQIHYLELPKLPKKEIEELEGVELWLEFLREAGIEDNEERLKRLMGRSETMKTAINQLQEISADEKMREIYRAREKSRLDMISKLKYAENKGRTEGREQGREEGREEGMKQGMKQGMIEMTKDLIREGVDIEMIIKASKLSKEEIEEIKKEMFN